MWRAVRASDAGYDGIFCFAVRSTGVFCRPSCTARKPRRENVRYFADAASAAAAGFRACKRCRPGVRSGRLLERLTAQPPRAENLRDAGITPILPINHGMTLSLYYQDPDGNQAELQIDLTTSDEADAFMASETFADNPLGVVFDPEEMAAQHRGGEDVTALSVYGPAS